MQFTRDCSFHFVSRMQFRFIDEALIIPNIVDEKLFYLFSYLFLNSKDKLYINCIF